MEKQDDNLYNEGKNLYGLGEYEKALIIFKKLSEKEPNSLDYSFAIGRTLSRLFKDKEALKYYQKILNNHPDHLSALLGYLISLGVINKDKKALKIIENELKKGDNAILLARKAFILSSNEKNQNEIFDLFNRALQLERDDAYIWYLKSVVYAKYLEDEKALDSLNRAISLVSESKTNLDNNNYVSKRDLLLWKIFLLQKLNEHVKALKYCGILLKSYKYDREALFYKISIYIDQANYDRALEVLDLALDIDPNDVYFLNFKGNIYLIKGSDEDALKVFNKITDINPEFEWGWANQVSIYYYRKEYQKAEEISKKTLNINSKNPFALYYGSLTMKKLNKKSIAREWEKRLSDPTVDVIFLEKNLQDRIANELWRLKKFGYDLKLKSREHILEDRRRIDILCEDINSKDTVVIELKRGKAIKDTYLQISHYMDSISNTIPFHRNVKGIVISSGYTKAFQKLIDNRSDISQIDFEQLGL
ncbi:MAG: endonuclease NucS [Methanobacterium sp.]|nr:endonuclease NucS [Methanobacterium sp.]